MKTIHGKVKRIQFDFQGIRYKPGDWIEFDETQTGQATRLAADDKIELFDYTVLLPDITIGVYSETYLNLSESKHNDDMTYVWSKRLNLETVQNRKQAKTDYVLSVNTKNPYILKNPAKLAAIATNQNYDIFAAFAYASDKQNLNQIPVNNKDKLSAFIPDLRIPVYSANWVFWRNNKANQELWDRFDELCDLFSDDVALTTAFYLHKPLLWALSDRWS